jgi:cyclopropane fatty-acyl-phospholipid synthase-like methyltransferase
VTDERPVEAHYDNLLGDRYTWMMGGPAACYSNAKALLDAAGIAAEPGDVALDLGAGGGYHARALAERGLEVIAVDSSAALLKELIDFCAGFGVTPVQANLLDLNAYRRRAPFALVLCVGDTLAHLETHAEVNKLISQAADLLTPGGKLLLQFREQATDMSPQNSVFTTRSERDRIMECVLHFWPDRVWVTDVVHEWSGGTWRSIRSTYPKLRLTIDEIVESARVAGLGVQINQPHARQRMLVFTRLS